VRRVLHGDCLQLMASMEAGSIDAICTDPPYGLGFMGRSWDHAVPGPEYWAEALRAAKPGAHVAAFGGTRCFHRMACAMEDAGWVIRDTLMWMYGSGFPKSLDVSKAIDRVRDDTTCVRNVCRWLRARMDERGLASRDIANRFGFHPRMVDHWAARDTDSQPTLPTLDQWDQLREMMGFGDDMDAEVYRLNMRKGEPGEAWAGREVVGTRRVPDGPGFASTLYGNTGAPLDYNDTAPATEAAKQWAGWGTALKPAWEPIILARKPLAGPVAANVQEHGTGALNVDGCRVGDGEDRGRWPANVILDPEAGAMLDAHADEAPARFFYCAKASRREREAGLHHRTATNVNDGRATSIDNPYQRGDTQRRNTHPTVKPVSLMRWLVRLITPPGGLVLDPFTGSGTTGMAAALEGLRFVGCEMEAEYVEIARARIAHVEADPGGWMEMPEEEPEDDRQPSLLDLMEAAE
jgi:DNA modification methylase